MTARLRTPFQSLSADNFISRGSAGQVFAISRNVFFKCPTIFDNPASNQSEEMEESIRKIDNEKAIYMVLIKHRHPSIVHGILCVPQGIFMQRLETTLQARLNQSTTLATGPSVQQRWIQQLISAVVWLEQLGYFHGDLRPSNILLGVMDNVRLGDFDATVKKGDQLLVASEPFCKLNKDYEPPLAGPVSEQFALGSCIYAIRFGEKPFHNFDAPTRVRKLIANEFPTTLKDIEFGDIICKCWHGAFGSIRALEQTIISRLYEHCGMKADLNCNMMDEEQYLMLLAECQEFLEENRIS